MCLDGGELVRESVGMGTREFSYDWSCVHAPCVKSQQLSGFDSACFGTYNAIGMSIAHASA